MIQIRKFEVQDAGPILDLFYETVHTVNVRDYTREQLDAWAPLGDKSAKRLGWERSLASHITYVAEIAGTIAGFGDMTNEGYIDRLYVHSRYQRQGIATALLKTLEDEAIRLGAVKLFTEASITAKPFFERHGYSVVKEQTVIRSGVSLINYQMVKSIEK
ncbi:acetyltransferase [Paenibacillus sp. J23TS9]|uniref:GNAT family N-acetyltransferase n=1 Tax=Paenibacillus sp. J23TS9 TaxID=2807193 RepID=UPI001AFF2524|nr:GNAT family N-acetyltransferase [Paenibacillus sp. J23TS9]GIP29444.1 acetyltransferase [Paenibacillus sp. J23TS9]